MSEQYHLPARLDAMQRVALVLGIVGLVVGAIGLAASPARFYNAYLLAWFFWLGISLGAMSITMLHHLTGGEWGKIIRRECEAAALVLPLMAVLFVPLAFGTESLFPWGDPARVSGDHILEFQSRYFNVTWFAVRAGICFAAWCVLAWLLCSDSMRFERSSDFTVVKKMRAVSAFGLVAYFVTVTVASIDWIMSREAHFYSTIIGLIVAMGMPLSALSFATALLGVLDDESEVLHALTPPRLNDIGNLLLTLLILWAYMSFSQLLVIWMGNLRPETPWYIARGIGRDANAWTYIAALLLVLHFFVPFLLLLSRTLKRFLPFLAGLAAMILVLRLVDLSWLILPSSPDRQYGLWLVPPLVLGIGGIWFYLFVAMLRRRPLLAREEVDPDELQHGPSEMEGGVRGQPGIH